jgi:hypothetical protein
MQVQEYAVMPKQQMPQKRSIRANTSHNQP